MDSLSHRIARRLRGILAILLAAGALAAVPAHAATVAPSSKLVSANNIQSVIDYLESKGDKTERSKSDDGDPMLNESNNYYSVYFWCEDNHASCDAIQFRACYGDYADATPDKANAVSRDYFYAKSYIDKEGRACLELPVSTGLKGISYEAMDLSYEAFIGFTQSADDYFGEHSD
ncbi:MAG: hypothetical protein J7496_15630 [Novosphingobium sp.]|nr:hypothetical protein [Novosphingobium sp.]MBO9603932.1 hypothetical protein [Novosphingobium sp.]